MPEQKQDNFNRDEQSSKGQRSRKGMAKNEKAIPDVITEVETFLATEIKKDDQKNESSKSILYLTEGHLISKEERNFIDLSSSDMLQLKSVIREIVSEELNKRG